MMLCVRKCFKMLKTVEKKQCLQSSDEDDHRPQRNNLVVCFAFFINISKTYERLFRSTRVGTKTKLMINILESTCKYHHDTYHV